MCASSLKLVDRKKILKIRSDLEASNEARDEEEVPLAAHMEVKGSFLLTEAM